MKTILLTAILSVFAAIALQAIGEPLGDCPCKVRHEVTTAGTAPQTVRFTEPFALLPACTAAFVGRPATDALHVTAVSRTVATVGLGASTPPFSVGNIIELSCTLTNRRH